MATVPVLGLSVPGASISEALAARGGSSTALLRGFSEAVEVCLAHSWRASHGESTPLAPCLSPARGAALGHTPCTHSRVQRGIVPGVPLGHLQGNACCPSCSLRSPSE